MAGFDKTFLRRVKKISHQKRTIFPLNRIVHELNANALLSHATCERRLPPATPQAAQTRCKWSSFKNRKG